MWHIIAITMRYIKDTKGAIKKYLTYLFSRLLSLLKCKYSRKCKKTIKKVEICNNKPPNEIKKSIFCEENNPAAKINIGLTDAAIGPLSLPL